jgi:hypothetical protein
MLIQFATCDRNRALVFLQKLYPNRDIKDEGLTARVLDFVEQDVIRIPDPDMHGSRVEICASHNYREEIADDVLKALQEFHQG